MVMIRTEKKFSFTLFLSYPNKPKRKYFIRFETNRQSFLLQAVQKHLVYELGKEQCKTSSFERGTVEVKL